jgi:hypothetical protein
MSPSVHDLHEPACGPVQVDEIALDRDGDPGCRRTRRAAGNYPGPNFSISSRRPFS